MSTNVQLLGLVMVCVIAGPAAAKDVTVGTTTLHLPPPAGYCELSERDNSEARVIKAITSGAEKSDIRILAISADCAELAAWHAGKQPTLNKLANYQTSASQQNQLSDSPEAIVEDTCGIMRSQGQQFLDQSPNFKSIKSRVEAIVGSVKINEVEFLGILGEEPAVCYAGTLQKVQTESGIITLMSTVASTVLNQKLLNSYLSTVYENGDTAISMLAHHRDNIEQLRRVNP